MVAPELREIEEFSLASGGFAHDLSHHFGLADRPVARALVLTALSWIPLLILSAIFDVAAGGHVQIPLLRDYGVYGRILLAIPILVIAEIPVGRRTRDVLRQFVTGDLVRPQDLPALSSAVRDAAARKNSLTAEVLILAIIYLSIGFRSASLLSDVLNTWYFSGGRITPAGWYLILVSLPIFQFLLLRWLWRLAVWAGLLRRISRLDLQLAPIHPDRMGGLGFLGLAQIPFGMIGLAGGAVISAYIVNHIVYRGLTLSAATGTMALYVVLAALILISPIFAFTDKLIHLRAGGILRYGRLGTEYARSFDHKWIGGSHPEEETLLGSADIQSLADLGNSYDIVQNMRIVPADGKTIGVIAALAAIPMVPVFFIALPFDEIVLRIIGALG